MRRAIIFAGILSLFSVSYLATGSSRAHSNQSILPADNVGIRLIMMGEHDKNTTDYIGLGQNYFFTAADGDWTTQPLDDNHDGVPDGVEIVLRGMKNGTIDGIDWTLLFSCAKVPGETQLVPGVYSNAQRYGLEATGHPGLSIGGEGRGCDTDFGSFTVLDAQYDTSFMPTRLSSFVATFDQSCEGAPLHLKGTIIYNSSMQIGANQPVISAVSYIARKGKLTIEGSNFDASNVVVVDGGGLALSSNSNVKLGGVIKIKGAIIGPGTHQIQVANYTGAISAPFTLRN